MKKFCLTAIALLVIMVPAASCSSGGNANPTQNNNAQATAAPTLAAGEPTAAPEGETATAEPTEAPTATTVAPGNLPQDLANAVNKTRDVLALRYEMSFSTTLTKNGKPVISQYTAKAEGNGTDQHTSFVGTSATLNQQLNYESIKTGGQSYIK